MRMLLLCLPAFLLCCARQPEPSFLTAARHGNLAMMQRLLDGGFNVDIRAENGKTALMIASQRGDVPTVQFLLKRAANVNLREKTGESAMSHAAYENHVDVLKILLQESIQSDILTDALIAAVAAGRTESTKLLIQEGVDPTKPNRYGVTAAMIAEHNGQRHLLPLLRKDS